MEDLSVLEIDEWLKEKKFSEDIRHSFQGLKEL
jgi:hypothetical protein